MAESMGMLRILMALREHNEDPTVSTFLVDLVLREADSSGQWQWKTIYRDKIVEYSAKGSNKDED